MKHLTVSAEKRCKYQKVLPTLRNPAAGMQLGITAALCLLLGVSLVIPSSEAYGLFVCQSLMIYYEQYMQTIIFDPQPFQI